MLVIAGLLGVYVLRDFIPDPFGSSPGGGGRLQPYEPAPRSLTPSVALPPVEADALIRRAHDAVAAVSGVTTTQRQRQDTVSAHVDLDPHGGLTGRVAGPSRTSGVLRFVQVVRVDGRCWVKSIGWKQTCDAGSTDVRSLVTIPDLLKLLAMPGPARIVDDDSDPVVLAVAGGVRITLPRAGPSLPTLVETGTTEVELSNWDTPVVVVPPPN